MNSRGKCLRQFSKFVKLAVFRTSTLISFVYMLWMKCFWTKTGLIILNSAPEFTEIEVWLLLTFLYMLTKSIKVGLSPPKNIFYLLQWKPFKNGKNVFNFALKPLSVLKIFKFLSWIFIYAEKRAWWERYG